jgi:hypothetical protein
MAEKNSAGLATGAWRQVVVVEVDEDSDLAGADSFLVSVFGSLLSLFDSGDELAPFSVLGAS